ncbi:MAG: hypothetical protein IKO93_13605 [Lentisphaeria bacterium]|nr:hypothetical protein [Lentisphaeria bacterium]
MKDFIRSIIRDDVTLSERRISAEIGFADPIPVFPWPPPIQIVIKIPGTIRLSDPICFILPLSPQMSLIQSDKSVVTPLHYSNTGFRISLRTGMFFRKIGKFRQNRTKSFHLRIVNVTRISQQILISARSFSKNRIGSANEGMIKRSSPAGIPQLIVPVSSIPEHRQIHSEIGRMKGFGGSLASGIKHFRILIGHFQINFVNAVPQIEMGSQTTRFNADDRDFESGFPDNADRSCDLVVDFFFSFGIIFCLRGFGRAVFNGTHRPVKTDSAKFT